MRIEHGSRAVAVARAHVEAWTQHDWSAAEELLADDVTVLVTTTQPTMKDTNTSGVVEYMRGLKEFAEKVVPGSLVVNANLGNERNALLVVTVEAALGPGGSKVRLPAARLYLLDERDRIAAERVVFFVTPA
jgi:hypothetical protein